MLMVRCAEHGAQKQRCFYYHSHANTLHWEQCPLTHVCIARLGATRMVEQGAVQNARCARKIYRDNWGNFKDISLAVMTSWRTVSRHLVNSRWAHRVKPSNGGKIGYWAREALRHASSPPVVLMAWQKAQ